VELVGLVVVVVVQLLEAVVDGLLELVVVEGLMKLVVVELEGLVVVVVV
jgi:hypothetical protein